jgi:hypothetical protein
MPLLHSLFDSDQGEPHRKVNFIDNLQEAIMKRFVVGALAVCACPLALIANAQEQQKEPTRSTAPYSYVPELSDLMIITYLRYSNLSLR